MWGKSAPNCEGLIGKKMGEPKNMFFVGLNDTLKPAERNLKFLSKSFINRFQYEYRLIKALWQKHAITK